MRNDIRYALRLILREPGYAAVVVLGLAIGIGVNTAIFSVVNGVLLRPLPYPEPDRLFTIAEVVPKVSQVYPRLPANLSHFYEWRKRCSSLERLSAMKALSLNLTGSEQPELLKAARVSANILDVLGVRPQLGRTFLEEEDPDGRDRVVILADSVWKRRFSADPSIVGSKIMLDGSPYLVIGVLPPTFSFPKQGYLRTVLLGEKIEIIKPLGYVAQDLKNDVGDFNYDVIARLRPGVPASKALSELNVVQSAISSTLSEKLDLRASLTPLQEEMVGQVRRGLLVVMAAVGAVLIVLCVNLANLSLARAAGRARDSAIRAALGASRSQLVRQMLAESVLLALLGGALGIVVARWGVRVLVSTAPVNLPRLSEVSVDSRVLGFALLTSLATGLIFGILPALRSAGTQPYEALKAGSHTSTEGVRGVRLRNALVSLEVGLSAVLLITAGLLIGSFVRLINVDKGFDVERVLALNLALPSTKYTNNTQRGAFFQQVLSKVENLPGVLSAGVVSALPLQGETWIDLVGTENDQRPFFERPKVNVRFISPGYFKTLRIPLRDGRTFDDSDRQKKVAIISHAVAENLWPGQNPVGRRMLHNETPVEVVGVTPDIRSTSLDKDPVLMLYVPYWQRARLTASLLVRTSMDPRSIAVALRGAVWEVDSEVPVPEMKTMQKVMADSVAQRRFQMMLVIVFAASALALAGLGTYGVVSYSVTRRRTEMGIRLALGADTVVLRRMVLRQGLLPVALGLAAGITAALAVGQLLQSLLFQVSARDPVTIVVVASVLFAVAAAACAVPAHRATRVDPVVALRFE
jgi:putative ABC transport system permease protein